MFFGRGDTSKLEDQEKETLTHLRRMVETGHIVSLSPDQTEIALRAIDFYRSWESVFRLGRSIRNISILIGGGLMFWWITGGHNFITAFIKQAVEK